MKGSDIKYKFILGCLKGIAYLPLNMLYSISRILAFISHRIIRYRVTVVRKNLQKSFPNNTKKELRTIESKFYIHLCDVIVETIKLLHISDKTLAKHIKIQNPELPKSIIEESGTIILFLGHYANWEWIPFLAKYFDDDIKMGTLYKPLHSYVMNKIMKTIRSRHGIELIENKHAYRNILERKRQKQKFMIGFIGDQKPQNSKQKYKLNFLNQTTDVFLGGETIGIKAGAKFLYLDVESNKRGYYNLIFKNMNIHQKHTSNSFQHYPYTNLFYKYLETSIKRSPHLWLWSHKRWNNYQ